MLYIPVNSDGHEYNHPTKPIRFICMDGLSKPLFLGLLGPNGLGPEEALYYPCDKGTDQLCSYCTACTADLHLCFRIYADCDAAVAHLSVSGE